MFLDHGNVQSKLNAVVGNSLPRQKAGAAELVACPHWREDSDQFSYEHEICEAARRRTNCCGDPGMCLFPGERSGHHAV